MSAEDRTPATEAIREAWVEFSVGDEPATQADRRAEFDHWFAGECAKAAEEAEAATRERIARAIEAERAKRMKVRASSRTFPPPPEIYTDCARIASTAPAPDPARALNT